MADYKVKLPVEWSNVWRGSPNEIYLSCAVSANINITIDENLTNVHCELSDYTESFEPGNASGGGFINIGGIAWFVPSFRYETSMSDPAVDSFARAWQELYTACPSLRTREIIAVAVDDSDRSYEKQQGTSWTQMDFPLSGNVSEIQNLTLVNSFVRFYDATGSSQNDWTAVSATDQSFSISFAPEGDIDFPYFPFAIMKTNTWRSANRTGGSVSRLENGVWIDKRNWLLTDENTTSQNMLDGGWTKLPIIGKE